MKVHPTYYTDTCLWETDDGVKAKSLAVLQAKLPKGTEIVGYAPAGFRVDREGSPENKPWRSPDNPALHTTQSYHRPSPEIVSAEEWRTPEFRQKEVEELTEREWAKEHLNEPVELPKFLPERQEELPLFEPAIPAASFLPREKLKKEAKKEPEPKPAPKPESKPEPKPAPKTKPKTDPRYTPDGYRIVFPAPRIDWAVTEPKLLKLIEDGCDYAEAAAALGVTVNAVIGRCHRRKIVPLHLRVSPARKPIRRR